MSDAERDGVREAWREWLADNGHLVLNAIREGVSDGMSEAFLAPTGTEILQAVTDAVREGVSGAMPWPSAILSAIADGTREAMERG